MEDFISDILRQFPSGQDLWAMVEVAGAFFLGCLILGVIGRFALGKRSNLNHAVSSAMGIVLIYAVTITLYSFNPGDLAAYLTALPYVTFSRETMSLFNFSGASIPTICSQVLSMVILAFLVNLLDTLIPKGKKIIIWYLYRFLTVLLAMALHFVVSWLLNAYLPGVLVTYAPMILLAILAVMLLIGISKVLLGVVLTAVNPIIGAIYAFFFSHLIGRQLSKAVLTTFLLTATVFLLEYLGYGVICIASVSLIAYIPVLIAVLILWYLIGHVL